MRRNDVLPTMSTGKGTSYIVDIGRSDDKSNMDPSREPSLDGAKVALFSKPEPVPTELDDGEGGSNKKEDPRFTAYSPLAYTHNVDLSAYDTLEFLDLPYMMRGHTNLSLDLGELEVGVSQDNPKLDSEMITSLILPMVKVDPTTAMLVLIANICSKFKYTSSYHNVWIAKQTVLEKMHSGWDVSHNEDGDRRIFPIAFAITPEELGDN
ncbi:hypothetical protein J1N35_040553 [Gossypium stocksii]|uniref:Uncharacterized protein n=1 Tax=Gossypium stocksii TaxID=47602 RepID=A0A9D3UE53_9ROSI|nr:hypothetical protein J1N35_040553 [Gossypium stocksii]